MSCYGKSDCPEVDLSQSLCNRRIANGEREKWVQCGGTTTTSLILAFSHNQGLSLKEPDQLPKSRKNINKFTLLNKQINITPTQVIEAISQIQKNQLTGRKDIHDSRALDSERVTNSIRL